MTTRVSVRAHAKLNLWLHVLAREQSGYHSIETLFHLIDLADDVTVSLAPPGERTIECSEDVGPAHENLAYRAAVMYCGYTDWPTGFHISIEKRIPARGGLGGGSADAAATLLALNALAPRRNADAELSEMAEDLGADVPFLLSGAVKALAWSHGERLLRLAPLPQRHVALVIPDFGIGTADAYGSVVIQGGWRPQLSVEDLATWSTIVRHARNDLEGSAAALARPALRDAITTLRAAGAVMARMTGSGSVVFGIFDDAPDAEALERATGFRVILTKTATAAARPVPLD